MASTLSTLTSKQLRKAASLREKIDKLAKNLAAILNVSPPSPAAVRKARRPRKKVAAAPARAPKRKRRFSQAARAKMAAAAKKRWAAAKAAGRKSL